MRIEYGVLNCHQMIFLFATCLTSPCNLSSFHISLIPDASKAISVGVLSKILLKAQLPKPTIAPIGPPYKKPPRLF